jgi:hypothetical protein
MLPHNDFLTAHMDKMKEFYHSVVCIEPSVEETVMNPTTITTASCGDIWMEKELSILHEWIRSNHFEMRSKSDIPVTSLQSILDACHVTSQDDPAFNEVKEEDGTLMCEFEITDSVLQTMQGLAPPAELFELSPLSSPMDLALAAAALPHMVDESNPPSPLNSSVGEESGSSMFTLQRFFALLGRLDQMQDQAFEVEKCAKLQSEVAEMARELDERRLRLEMEGVEGRVDGEIEALRNALSVYQITRERRRRGEEEN